MRGKKPVVKMVFLSMILMDNSDIIRIVSA
jgi:hypothetical protein